MFTLDTLNGREHSAEVEIDGKIILKYKKHDASI
jgi:hypothetical protein